MLLMGRCPARVSRSRSHSGDGPTATPVSSAAVYRAHSAGSSISTVARDSTGAPSSGYVSSGSATCAPEKAATSRATPSTEKQSGRLAVTSNSSTVSPR